MIRPSRRRRLRTTMRRVIIGRREGHTWPIELVYDPHDPWAVSIDLTPRHATSSWWGVTRDLLAAGMDGEQVGCGDVRFAPIPRRPWVTMHLSCPEGQGVIDLPTYPVVEWLTLTYDLVPQGDESDWMDLDRDIAQLLGGVR